MVLKIALFVTVLGLQIVHGAQSSLSSSFNNGNLQDQKTTSGFHALISHRRGHSATLSPSKSPSFRDANGRSKSTLGSFSDIFGLARGSSDPIHSDKRQPRELGGSHRIGAASTVQNTNVRPDSLFVSSGEIVWPEGPSSSDVKFSQFSVGRKGTHTFLNGNTNAIHDDALKVADLSVLDVHHPQSPYGLIQDVLPRSKLPPPMDQAIVEDAALGLNPEEVWLSDGDLLVLKGGTTSAQDGFDNPWEPLDDYEAPYREPVLAPENVLETHKGQFSGIAVFLPSIQEAHFNHMRHNKNRQQEEISGRSPRIGGFHSLPTYSNTGKFAVSQPLPSSPRFSSNSFVFPRGHPGPSSSHRSMISGGSSVAQSTGWIPSSPSFNSFLSASLSYQQGTPKPSRGNHPLNFQLLRHTAVASTSSPSLRHSNSDSPLGITNSASSPTTRPGFVIPNRNRNTALFGVSLSQSQPPSSSHHIRSILYQNIPTVTTVNNLPLKRIRLKLDHQPKHLSDEDHKINSTSHSVRSSTKLSNSGADNFYYSLSKSRPQKNVRVRKQSYRPPLVTRQLSTQTLNSEPISPLAIPGSLVTQKQQLQPKPVFQSVNKPIQSLQWSPDASGNLWNRARYVPPLGHQLQGIQFLQQRPV
ncbi:uncharacterized protein LOC131878447 [Tigriopus californicus]|uniref:uncharacterized protein LOC131878447 n=1 Tax=Tigriopus californicus TaxID=6832 RepID=UPI0027DA4657|nr:uncharacterized protein LOC131878447 [Tigriopus californicus]